MQVSENVEKNLISYIDYGFLDLGGFFNIDLNQSGDYVSNLSSLTKVVDNRGFTYWAGPKNWVYESGAYSSGVNAPAQIYVNNNLYSLGSINYKDGCVYNIPATGTSVKASFAYKWIKVDSANNLGYGKTIKVGQNRTDVSVIGRSGAPELSVSLPFISIDVPPITSNKAYGMGGDLTPMIYKFKAKATIVSDNPSDVKRIADVLVKQEGFSINTYNANTVRSSGAEPLNSDGTLKSGKTHDQLSALYEWSPVFFRKITGSDLNNLSNGLFETVVRFDLEVVSCGC